MSEQKQVRESRRSSEQDAEQNLETETVNTETSSLSDDLDGLLDEIDDVLEVNAEDFIKNYVQKGGQ